MEIEAFFRLKMYFPFSSSSRTFTENSLKVLDNRFKLNCKVNSFRAYNRYGIPVMKPLTPQLVSVHSPQGVVSHPRFGFLVSITEQHTLGFSSPLPKTTSPRLFRALFLDLSFVAAVAEWYRYRTVACFVTSSSPVPLKTRRVGQRCTLNLSRAETSSRWCGVVVRRGGASSGVVHVT
ncbi:uncharacterized protein TNCV_2865551 [Trichonephila clavipes]|nr:uncharacterized protein TNCV_2865551 [Trichonephila clavipes]